LEGWVCNNLTTTFLTNTGLNILQAAIKRKGKCVALSFLAGLRLNYHFVGGKGGIRIIMHVLSTTTEPVVSASVYFASTTGFVSEE
jgi:hypothetical protein